MDLIRRCNRSVPHIEIISATLDIVINLSKYEKGRQVMLEPNCCKIIIDSVTEVSLRFKDKSHDIFTKSCAILWVMAHFDVAKQVCS